MAFNPDRKPILSLFTCKSIFFSNQEKIQKQNYSGNLQTDNHREKKFNQGHNWFPDFYAMDSRIKNGSIKAVFMAIWRRKHFIDQKYTNTYLAAVTLFCAKTVGNALKFLEREKYISVKNIYKHGIYQHKLITVIHNPYPPEETEESVNFLPSEDVQVHVIVGPEIISPIIIDNKNIITKTNKNFENKTPYIAERPIVSFSEILAEEGTIPDQKDMEYQAEAPNQTPGKPIAFLETTTPKDSAIDKKHIKVIANWNALVLETEKLKTVDYLTENRSQAITNITNLLKVEEKEVDQYLDMIFKNKYLTGENKHCWEASFDWSFKVDNAMKILNGSYAENGKQEFEKEANDIIDNIHTFGRYGYGLAKRYFDESSLAVIKDWGGWERLCGITEFQKSSVRSDLISLFKKRNNKTDDKDDIDMEIQDIYAKISAYGRYHLRDAKKNLNQRQWKAIEGWGGWERLCELNTWELNKIKKDLYKFFKG